MENITEPHTIQMLRDSIQIIVPYIANIAENTRPFPYTWVSVLISFFSTAFGYLGYKWAKKTAENVSRITPAAQLAICNDYVENLYRNIVYTHTFVYTENVPSDNLLNALILSDFSDVFSLTDYPVDSEVRRLIKEVKQRHNNYNAEISVVMNHISGIEKTLTDRDRQNLLNKPMLIIVRASEVCSMIGHYNYYKTSLQNIMCLHLPHILRNAHNAKMWIDRCRIDFIDPQSIFYKQLQNFVRKADIKCADMVCNNPFIEEGDILIPDELKQYEILIEYHSVLCNLVKGNEISQESLVRFLYMMPIIDAAIEYDSIS